VILGHEIEASTHKHRPVLGTVQSPTYLLDHFGVCSVLIETWNIHTRLRMYARANTRPNWSNRAKHRVIRNSSTVRGEVHCICTTPYPSYQTATSSSWHARQATRQRSMADIQRSNPCTHTPTYGTGVPRAWYTNILGSQLSSLFITPEIHYKNRVKIQISNLGLMIRKLQCVHDSKI